MFSALQVCYDNALYKFTFEIDIDIGIKTKKILIQYVKNVVDELIISEDENNSSYAED